MADRPSVRRCAIYTRKSSDEGLDQAYNSLAAQRDACAAYVASQKHEGWVTINKAYDDGGFSGGSLERPALQLLLDDLAKGAIDIIVVYKIDRLTRSLADFAKLTELLDKHQVSFVAVTQQFNTSTSMGRLTLNVLLSFAQFEREVTGERIRDKIAASKRRGMWMGGHPPLGYDVRDRKLIINTDEAAAVRHIFRRYLTHKSVELLRKELEQSNIRSKQKIWKDGTIHGGMPFSRGALYTILKNPIYRGLIPHKAAAHPGEHDAIIGEDLFQDVQKVLAQLGPGEAARTKRASRALLQGLTFDAFGQRLQPTHCRKGPRKYRYYVSAVLLRSAKDTPDGLRVPAADFEKIVIYRIAARLRDKVWLTSMLKDGCAAKDLSRAIQATTDLASLIEHQLVENTGLLQQFVNRIEVSKSTIKIRLDISAMIQMLLNDEEVETVEAAGPHTIDILVSGQFLRCGKQVRLVVGPTAIDHPIPEVRLIQDVLRARRWFDDLASGKVATIAALARRDKCSASYISLKISLAFLAPDVLQSILDGTQHPSLTPERLKKACPLPTAWDEQRALLLS